MCIEVILTIIKIAMKLKFFINEMNIFLAAQYNEVINSVDVVFMNLILDLMEIGKITT